MIRVSAGRYKGRRLGVAPGVGTRPSSGKIKEALFSSLGERVQGRRLADLFAGSGALGIEALSRGAEQVVFVETDPRAIAVIRGNLKKLEIEENAAVLRRVDAWRWLQGLGRGELPESERVDGILLDPPYSSENFEHVLSLALGLLESKTIEFLALEHPSRSGEDGMVPSTLCVTTRRHGHSAFSIVERAST